MANKSIPKITLNICIISIFLFTLAIPVVTTYNMSITPIQKPCDSSHIKSEYIPLTNSLYNGGGWNKTYGGEGVNRGYSVQETHEEGYIIAGYTNKGEYGLDFLLIKTNATGEMEWIKTYGDTNHSVREKCYCVKQTSDLGFIMVGRKYIIGDWGKIWLIKTDAHGQIQWKKTYGEDKGVCGGYEVHQTTDGGYIIAGYKYSLETGHSDIWLIKTTSTGDILWDKIYGGAKDDMGYSVEQTIDGGYILGGYTQSYEDGSGILLIKTNNQGEKEWSQTYTGGISSVRQTHDGGYLIVGSITEKLWLWGYSPSVILVIKTDAQGNSEWTKKFGTTHHRESGGYGEPTHDGGYIIVGETFHVRSSTMTGDWDSNDMWLIKADNVGNPEWMKKLGGEYGEYAHEVHETLDGGYIIIGDTQSFGAGDIDIWLIKTQEPSLKIEVIPQFTGLSIQIKNTGNNDLSNISWSVYIDGMILAGGNEDGTINELPVGEEIIVLDITLFGAGPVAIIVTAGESAMIFRCFLIGNFMFPY